MGVTLSGLLNVLDGFYAPTRRAVRDDNEPLEKFWTRLCCGRDESTTGCIWERPAIGQKIELYRRFFPEASELKRESSSKPHGLAETMAEFQGLLLGLAQGEARSDLLS